MAKGGSGAMKRWLWLAAAIVFVDQLTKFAILRSFSFGERLAVVPGLFDLTLVYNRGAAFSFLAGASGWQRWFFTGLGVAAAIFIVWLLARHGTQRLFAFALALILGGAIGNVIDRVARGQVVDFLLVYWQRWHWPAFNVADSAITVGAVLLIVDEFRRVRRGR
ncbi:MAG: lipoprotein signal peptidase [Burkholderiaceae bacterium]|jgi:signal peptidase II|uniref:signal peptidase II n=1 Tax=Comamonas sp. SCN 65-56 TaxID=1660095 RepID=UPI00086A18FA|nr:signal peptidase II [Comamonas sp. SCN 65-56]MBX3592453.1 lipoprotein signal peptidase [Burkholderiaceae bacterium]MBX3613459.1 lipoprotein signal peptidase [Burkholderiaceae bacterium]ODS89186.1 MAG: signal peptidase II [Comamonas sp. SCN 65-56]HMN64550.1 signal peptidase II [Burkholderiaceae bacterium]